MTLCFSVLKLVNLRLLYRIWKLPQKECTSFFFTYKIGSYLLSKTSKNFICEKYHRINCVMQPRRSFTTVY